RAPSLDLSLDLSGDLLLVPVHHDLLDDRLAREQPSDDVRLRRGVGPENIAQQRLQRPAALSYSASSGWAARSSMTRRNRGTCSPSAASVASSASRISSNRVAAVQPPGP